MTRILRNYIVVLFIIAPILYFISRLNYTLFHTMIEFIILVIGINIFVISQIPRIFNKKNEMLILLGPGLLAASLINIFHILTYEGIRIIGIYGTNTSTQLWVILNFVLSLSFLCAAINLRKKANYSFVLISTLVISGIFTILPFLKLFPVCFIPGQGTTLFKMVCEFAFVFIYLATYIIMVRLNKVKKIYKLRNALVIGFLMLSHLCFLSYFSIFDFSNFIGHYARLASFGIMFIILVYDLIYEPYKELLYSSLHDELTQIFNRKYFESLIKDNKDTTDGIIVFDIDGLRLINESLGHDFGDKIIVVFSEILKNSLDENCILARIGGDEFVVLIEKQSNNQISSLINKIQESISKYNQNNNLMPLSVSIGYATKNLLEYSLIDIFKQADDNLRREKLLNFNSSRSAVVKALVKTLETRDVITEDHSKRVKNLVLKLSIACGITENKINDILLFSEFHDIGKVGISDNLLLKKGRLTKDEFLEMQKHTEYGYNIAKSTTELVHISDWILKHHERWDGGGYPLGIKGVEIPIECRILSIVDSYDAMTNNRPYRNAMSKEMAVEELIRCAGTQFDPQIIDLFLHILI